MFECIGILFFLAVSVGIVWLAFLIGELKETTNNLLGDIKMKQEDFDRKVNDLMDKADRLDSNLENESGEINSNLNSLRDEIARLKESQGDKIDTSRLDEISNRLDSSAQRIGGLVDPLVAQGTTQEAPTVPAETVDPLPPVAGEVETPQEEVAEFPTGGNRNEAGEAGSSEKSETESGEDKSDSEAESSESAKSEDDK